MRLIDADEAILQIERREKHLVGDLFISVDAMKEFIKNRPTIDPVKQEWISVKDRLPTKGKYVLLLYAKNNKNPTLFAKNTMAVGRYEQGMFLVEGCSVFVSHWMPLPEPPENE